MVQKRVPSDRNRDSSLESMGISNPTDRSKLTEDLSTHSASAHRNIQVETVEDRSKLDSESRFCPACKEVVPLTAAKCPYCLCIMDDHTADIDERYQRLYKKILIGEAKDEIIKWMRNNLWILSISFIVLGGLVMFLIQMIIKYEAREAQIQIVEKLGELQKLEVKLETQLSDTKTVTEGVSSKFEDSEDRIKQLEIDAEKAILDFKRETDFISTTQIMAISSEIRADVADFISHFVNINEPVQDQQQPSSDSNLTDWKLPKPTLVSPISLNRSDPFVILGNRARLQWYPPTMSAENYEYQVELSNQRFIESGDTDNNVIHSRIVPESTMEISSKETVEHVPPIFGQIYWRVRYRELGAIDTEAQTNGKWSRWSDVGLFRFYQNTLQRIRSTKKVIIGIGSSFDNRFSQFLNNELTGFDIELARMIVDELGQRLKRNNEKRLELKPHFVPYGWVPLLRAPSTQKVDFIIASITIKEEREGFYRLAFSEPYYENKQTLIFKPEDLFGVDLNTNKINEAFELLKEDLKERGTVSDETRKKFDPNGMWKNLRIAAQEGTTNAELAMYLVSNDKNVKRVLTAAAIKEAVKSGDCQAAILDEHMADEQFPKIMSESCNKKDALCKKYIFDEKYGIAVPNSEKELLRAINCCIRSLKDGPENRLAELKKDIDKKFERTSTREES